MLLTKESPLRRAFSTFECAIKWCQWSRIGCGLRLPNRSSVNRLWFGRQCWLLSFAFLVHSLGFPASCLLFEVCSSLLFVAAPRYHDFECLLGKSGAQYSGSVVFVVLPPNTCFGCYVPYIFVRILFRCHLLFGLWLASRQSLLHSLLRSRYGRLFIDWIFSRQLMRDRQLTRDREITVSRRLMYSGRVWMVIGRFYSLLCNMEPMQEDFPRADY